MKTFKSAVLVLLMLLCLIVIGYSSKNTSSVLSKAIPENITHIEVSGFYNGELEPWELTQAEIEELNTWITQLSLKRRTYAEGEAPNEVYSGGVCYSFNINHGEMSFTWTHINKAYIQHDGEWYEITNTTAPPLDLAGRDKPGK